jgi:hypothetical protein
MSVRPRESLGPSRFVDLDSLRPRLCLGRNFPEAPLSVVRVKAEFRGSAVSSRVWDRVASPVADVSTQASPFASLQSVWRSNRLTVALLADL